MITLLAKISQIISQHAKSKNYFVGYSGGMDSHLLLHILSQMRKIDPDVNLTAIHINHNLSVNAQKWVEHCRSICNDLNVPLIVKDVDVKAHLQKKNKQSIEALARDLRYEILADILSVDGVVFTAHHEDDLVETVLLQLFRGAGPKGLAAMPMATRFARGLLLRPLLQFSRVELLGYANSQQLRWIEDESNTNENFARNYIRHQVMPLIRSRWNGVTAAVVRVAQHSAESSHLLDILANDDLQKTHGSISNTLSVTKLLLFEVARQKNVIRYWLRQLQLPTPSTVKLEQLITDVLHCNGDANPLVNWKGAEIRRYGDDIYAMRPLSQHDPDTVLAWDLLEPLILPGDLGVLVAQCKNRDRAAVPQNITVRFRVGGEKCRPKGRGGHSHTLQKLMQEWRIAPWMRNRIPLIYKDNKLIAVVGYCVCEEWELDCEVAIKL